MSFAPLAALAALFRNGNLATSGKVTSAAGELGRLFAGKLCNEISARMLGAGRAIATGRVSCTMIPLEALRFGLAVPFWLMAAPCAAYHGDCR